MNDHLKFALLIVSMLLYIVIYLPTWTRYGRQYAIKSQSKLHKLTYVIYGGPLVWIVATLGAVKIFLERRRRLTGMNRPDNDKNAVTGLKSRIQGK